MLISFSLQSEQKYLTGCGSGTCLQEIITNRLKMKIYSLVVEVDVVVVVLVVVVEDAK